MAMLESNQNHLEQNLVQQIDEVLSQHYSDNVEFLPEKITQLFQEFTQTGYVKFENFAPPIIETAIKGEVYSLIEQYSIRRNVKIEVTGNTPRIMGNVGQPIIARESKIIPLLYHSSILMELLSRIVGKKVITCPYEKEKFVITKMSNIGDTHGWHWDDYSYSFVWFIETPPPEMGGILELIPNTNWDKKNPRVDYYLNNCPIQQKTHNTGEAYLIKADTTMHHVTPLKQNADRIILNMAWANEDDLKKEISHETMLEMYDY